MCDICLQRVAATEEYQRMTRFVCELRGDLEIWEGGPVTPEERSLYEAARLVQTPDSEDLNA